MSARFPLFSSYAYEPVLLADLQARQWGSPAFAASIDSSGGDYRLRQSFFALMKHDALEAVGITGGFVSEALE